MVAAADDARSQTDVFLLGDSITQGGQSYASYRYELWFGLTDAGYLVEFVGSRDFINGGNPPNLDWYPLYETTFDRDHEGYWGWRTDEIAGIITSIATQNPPEIALIHLGTNDVGQLGAPGVANADTNLRLIIDRMRAVVPTVTILLAQVIPIGPGSGYFPNADQIDPLNAAIAAIVSDKTTAQSPIVLIDQNTGYDLGTMMQPDGLHPNLLGEAQMAGVWRTALEPLLTIGNPPPTVFLTAPADGAAFVEPATILLEATASDSNGSVVAVRFYENGNFLGSDTTSPFSFAWTGVSTGAYTLTAVAEDDEGATRTSAPVDVIVVPFSSGDVVPVFNPSFEEPVLSDGALASGPGTIGGWVFDATPQTFLGIFNPPEGSYPGAAGNGTPVGAEGANVAFLFNDGGPSESVSVTQLLTENVAANREYLLTVAIGKFLPDQPYSPSTYGGYVIELLAGGSTVIASDSDSIDPAIGEFQDAFVSVRTTDIDAGLLGQPLSVRLGISATEEDRSTHFDNVRVVSRPISLAPGMGRIAEALLLLGLLVVGTVFLSRR